MDRPDRGGKFSEMDNAMDLSRNKEGSRISNANRPENSTSLVSSLHVNMSGSAKSIAWYFTRLVSFPFRFLCLTMWNCEVNTLYVHITLRVYIILCTHVHHSSRLPCSKSSGAWSTTKRSWCVYASYDWWPRGPRRDRASGHVGRGIGAVPAAPPLRSTGVLRLTHFAIDNFSQSRSQFKSTFSQDTTHKWHNTTQFNWWAFVSCFEQWFDESRVRFE